MCLLFRFLFNFCKREKPSLQTQTVVCSLWKFLWFRILYFLISQIFQPPSYQWLCDPNIFPTQNFIFKFISCFPDCCRQTTTGSANNRGVFLWDYTTIASSYTETVRVKCPYYLASDVKYATRKCNSGFDIGAYWRAVSDRSCLKRDDMKSDMKFLSKVSNLNVFKWLGFYQTWLRARLHAGRVTGTHCFPLFISHVN